MTKAVDSEGAGRRVCVMTADSGRHVAPLIFIENLSVPSAIPNTPGRQRCTVNGQAETRGLLRQAFLGVAQSAKAFKRMKVLPDLGRC